MQAQEEELEERLRAVYKDIISSGEEIERHISSLYFASSLDLKGSPIDLKRDSRAVVPILKQDLASILEDQKGIRVLSIAEDGRRSEEALRDLDQVCKISDLALRCDHLISGSDIKQSVECLLKLEAEIKSLPRNEVGTGRVCQTLKRESIVLRSALLSRLNRLLDSCIRIEFGKISVQKVLKEDDTSIDLNDIWNGFVELKCADRKVASISTNLWQHILEPLWSHQSNQSTSRLPTEKVSADYSEMQFNFASPVSSSNSNSLNNETLLSNSSNRLSDKATRGAKLKSMGCKMPIHLFIDSINQVVSFSYLQMGFWSHEGLQNALSAEFLSNSSNGFPSLIDGVKGAIIASIPDVESKLGNFQSQLMKPVEELVKQLENFGFLSSEESPSKSILEHAPSSIDDFSTNLFKLGLPQDITTLFAEQRRSLKLDRARELMLSEYHNIMPAFGDAREDGCDKSKFSAQLLQFEPCQVSQTSWKILRLIHDTMSEAVDSSSINVAQILFLTCRDIIELFMAIVPIKYTDITQSPKLGTVFFNDCLYIAHNLTLLFQSYRLECVDRPGMHDVLSNTAPMIDLVPKLRDRGGNIFNAHLESRRRSLLDSISKLNINTLKDEGDSFSSSSIAGFLDIHRTVTQASSIVQNDLGAAKNIAILIFSFCNEWKDILQKSIFERVSGFLLDTMYKTILQPIMDAENITVMAAAEICRIMRALQGCRSVISNDPIVVDKMVPSAHRFDVVADLLEMTMSDIAHELSRRKFSCFTTGQLISLIKAIFEENETRAALIAQIK